MKLRPFFSFYGGKWRAAPHYPAPAHDVIIEPFAGSAGYAMRHHERQVIIVERDPLIAATWRYLLTVTEDEILSLPDIEMEQSVSDLEVSASARLLVGWWINAGSSSASLRPSKWMRARRRPNSYWGPAIRRRIASQLASIRHWVLIEGDYSEAPSIEATWFIDPPYAVAGRRYRFGCRRIDYNALGWWCRCRRGQVMVCESVGASWLPFAPWRDVPATSHAGVAAVSREALWTNDAPSQGEMFAGVHDE